MNNVWDGTHVFTWEIEKICGGDINTTVQLAKQLGITGVIIKFANGSLANDPVSQGFMDQFKRYTPVFRQAGIRVGGWIYQYLTDVQGEFEACVEAINAGAEWIVLDGEKELLGKEAQVRQFGQLFRSHYPDYTLTLSSFCIPDYHSEVPWNEYNQFVNAMMPQIYWAEMGWSADKAFQVSIQSFSKFGKPILPTGQSCEAALPQDQARFAQLCKQFGTHLSFWDMDEANVEQLEAIRNNILPVVQLQQPAQWQIDIVNKALANHIITQNHNPLEQTTITVALAILMNAMKIKYYNPNTEWKTTTLQKATELGFIHNAHQPDELVNKATLLTILLNAMHINIPDISSDWKANSMSAAMSNGLIHEKHDPDEIAPVWFTLATIMNALKI